MRRVRPLSSRRLPGTACRPGSGRLGTYDAVTESVGIVERTELADPASDFLPFAVPDIGEEEIAAVVEAMRSGWLTTGPEAAGFEDDFRQALGGHVQAIAVNSATAGLHLALEALGVGPGDSVLVPTWTFTATAEVVRYLGAEPIFVDVDEATLNMDLDAASALMEPRTTAIQPVHFGGLPMGRGALSEFADRHGLAVVEDAAHAFPALSDGVAVGAGSSAATVFSFYATKTMTTGEGGMLVTPHEHIAARARTMRLHGISRDVFQRYRSTSPAWNYEVVAPGFKYNLTDPAAAMGRVQLRRAPAMRASRESIAERYFRGLVDLPIQLPPRAAPDDTHAWHLFVIRMTSESPLSRDRFIERMAEEGVGCSVHFIPLHLQPYWRDRYSLKPADLPVATAEFSKVVSLPLFSGMTAAQVDRVVEVAHRVLE